MTLVDYVCIDPNPPRKDSELAYKQSNSTIFTSLRSPSEFCSLRCDSRSSMATKRFALEYLSLRSLCTG